MPRKVFDPFTRLDASDINTYLMDQSVMSFAGTAARSSAIPAPTDGMPAYLQDSDTLTIYNGSSWIQAGEQTGFVLIDNSSFTAVTTHSRDGLFTADYTNYKIIVNISTSSVNGAALTLRTRNSTPADETGTVYEVGEYKVGAANSQAAASVNSLASTSGTLGLVSSTSGFSVEINMYNPFLTQATKYHSIGAGGNLQVTGVAWTTTTSYQGLKIIASSGNITGTMTVYGNKEG